MLRRIVLIVMSISSAYAATPIDGLYSVAFGGLALEPGNINNAINNYQISNSQYASGFNAGGALGYKQAFWRYEAEVSYIKADLNQVNIDHVKYRSPSVLGYSQAVVGLLNAYVDLPFKQASLLQPFIGAGLGYAWVQNDINVQPYINSLFNHNAFAYQGTAGLTFHFSENYGLNVAYRYVGTTHINQLGNTFQAHLISGGAIYRFDECEFK
jgi:opacity protein-like surface antigen